jgi:hypothetical protein
MLQIHCTFANLFGIYVLTSKTLPDTPQMTSSFLFLCTGELYYVPFRSLLISTMYVWAEEGGLDRGHHRVHIEMKQG